MPLLACLVALPGCKPIVRNPIDLGEIGAAHGLAGTRPAAAWVISTRTPKPARTDGVTLPAGSAAAFVSVSGTPIPPEQLLAESEQVRIARVLLAAISNEAPSSGCRIAIAFDGVDYAFHEHQYWSDVTMTVTLAGTPVLDAHERLWSANGMSTWQRLNTTPQQGKQALAEAIIARFVALADGSQRYREACGAR